MEVKTSTIKHHKNARVVLETVLAAHIINHWRELNAMVARIIGYLTMTISCVNLNAMKVKSMTLISSNAEIVQLANTWIQKRLVKSVLFIVPLVISIQRASYNVKLVMLTAILIPVDNFAETTAMKPLTMIGVRTTVSTANQTNTWIRQLKNVLLAQPIAKLVFILTPQELSHVQHANPTMF